MLGLLLGIGFESGLELRYCIGLGVVSQLGIGFALGLVLRLGLW